MTEYRTLYIDPPWYERGAGKIQRGADRHYPLLKTKDIAPTILNGIEEMGSVADSAHLYLWVTNNKLKDGLLVLDQLGFRYITNIVWVKRGNYGLGRYFRGQHELMLFGVKGKGAYGLVQTKTENTVIYAGRRAHSQKPIEAYEKIEAVSPGPYLEMFARSRRQGWDSWGNEAPEGAYQATL